jgi:hypothetical protein
MVQDWVYWDRHSLELTLELNPIMKPPAEEVGGIMWQQNLPALMRFMELVRAAGCYVRYFTHVCCTYSVFMLHIQATHCLVWQVMV